eukprot:12533380-Alexandrium_andersonii.AAC.1
MRVLEECRPGSYFEEKLWEMEALTLDGEFVAHIMGAQNNKRMRMLCISTSHFDINQVEMEAKRLWKVWGGYEEKPTDNIFS